MRKGPMASIRAFKTTGLMSLPFLHADLCRYRGIAWDRA